MTHFYLINENSDGYLFEVSHRVCREIVEQMPSKAKLSIWLFLSAIQVASSSTIGCGPGKKPLIDSSFSHSHNSSICVDLDNRDVLAALNWLSDPPKPSHPCKNITVSQGLSVCEDFLSFPLTSQSCNIVSFIGTNWCDHYGSLAFERYWADRGCNVTLYHFHIRFKGIVYHNISNMPFLPCLVSSFHEP